MHSLAGVVKNHVLIAGLIGWFLAQTLKIPIYYLVEGKWDLHRFHGAGGMPSSHTAMTVAATIMVGALEGFQSALFAVSALFCCHRRAPRDGPSGHHHQPHSGSAAHQGQADFRCGAQGAGGAQAHRGGGGRGAWNRDCRGVYPGFDESSLRRRLKHGFVLGGGCG